jgi:hypothetical protein
MAAARHQAYREGKARDRTEVSKLYDKPYADLGEAEKHDNRAAVQRIPRILALAGLGVERDGVSDPAPGPSSAELESYLRHHIIRLAEAEHDGWWDIRSRNGWRLGEKRCDDKLLHPGMVNFGELKKEDKDRDSNTVLDYEKLLKTAGYRIVWLPAFWPPSP